MSDAATSLLLGTFACVVTALAFAVVSQPCRHWFLFPVTLCGILVAPDAVDWLRGRLPLFDPVGVLGLFGVHFFFLAPMLHVAWDYWMSYIIPPDDWRPWLGWMAVLNALGLFVYRFVRILADRWLATTRPGGVWRINPVRFYPLVLLALACTGLLQAWVYQQAGGIMAYIETATDPDTHQTAMQGMGVVFTFSESFPILAMMAFTAYAAGKPWLRSWLALVPVLVLFVALQLLFGGLRGSRSNTVWALFWAVGMIHFWLRPITRQTIAFGMVALVLFMYAYGLYKNAGLEGLRVVGDSSARAELAQKTGRTVDALLLGDLGRSDVHAFLLHQILRPDSDFEYSWGRTYVGDLVILVPRALWPDRPVTKVLEGTELISGRGSYNPGVWVTSRVFGIAGEAMLNYGPALVPFAFVPFGLAVAWVSRLFRGPTQDVRRLLYPFGVIFCFVVLVGDLDNVLFDVFKNLTVPWLILALGSDRVPDARGVGA